MEKKFPNKKRRTQPRKNQAADDRKEVKRDIHNDPSWYMSDTQLINDVASISFNTALGNSVTLRGPSNNLTVNLPGIMAIYTTPTIGVSKNANSPVNIAMRRLYTFVRHQNSGHSNYDPADLMLYILAMDSIYTYWAYMVRAYGVAQVFSRTNKYVGDALLTAMGINPGDLRQNLANFRAYINVFAGKAMQWCVPKVMTYFLRHNWMYSNIYKDEDDSKSQMYMYVPAGLYQYHPTLSAGAGGLQMMPLTVGSNSTSGLVPATVPNTYTALVAYGNELLRALAGQEDIGIISGDILKAYGAENLWRIDTIPENYAVAPVYSEEVLAQIHNTDFASKYIIDSNGTSVDLAGLNVFQDVSIGSGELIFDPIFNASKHLEYDSLVDFWKEGATADDIMVATRNKLAGVPFESEAASVLRAHKLSSCGSEIALFGVIWTLAGNVILNTQTYAADNYSPSHNDITKFNEAPIRPVFTSNGVYSSYFGELSNYGVFSRSNIDQIHEVALMSMFGVPYLK
jgi:hypothetical protein